jgi:lipopolysaccharide export system protein LptC
MAGTATARPARWWPTFRRRGRGSRSVGWLRFLLPTLALALVALVVLWPQLNGGYGGLIMPMLNSGNVPGAEDAMRMDNPRYVGQTKKSEPYAITADSARLDPDDADRIHLDRMDAEITTAEQRDVRLLAQDGVYNRASEELDLAGGIELTTADGYRFVTESAHVDLDAGRVKGERPITGTGPSGDLSADRFEITRGGDVLQFECRVKVIIEPQTANGRNS